MNSQEEPEVEEIEMGSAIQNGKKKQHRAVWTEDKVKVLVEAYRYEKGNWEAIMKNPRVIELGYDKPQLQNKIKTINGKRIRKTWNDSGTKKRESIVKNIHGDTDKDEEHLQKKRREFSAEKLSEEEKALEEVEEAQVSSAVDSSSFSTSGEFEDYAEEEKTRRKKQRLTFQNISNQKLQAIQAIHDEQEQNKVERAVNALKEGTLMQTLELNQMMLAELFKNIRNERSQPDDNLKEEVEKIKQEQEIVLLKLSRIEELLTKQKE